MEQKGYNVILFDEVCNLCKHSANFVTKRDKNKVFTLIPLQSSIGKDMLTIFGLAGLKINSLVFIEDCKPYLQSTAGLRILNKLGGPWKIFMVFIIIPKPLRDFVYNLISKYRYKWFGKRKD